MLDGVRTGQNEDEDADGAAEYHRGDKSISVNNGLVKAGNQARCAGTYAHAHVSVRIYHSQEGGIAYDAQSLCMAFVRCDNAQVESPFREKSKDGYQGVKTAIPLTAIAVYSQNVRIVSVLLCEIMSVNMS